MTTGRKCKRKDARRRIAFQLTQSQIVKSDPSVEAIREMTLAIANNKLALFGIGRLSKLNLNVTHVLSDCYQCKPGAIRAGTAGICYPLIRIAAGLGRDGIVSSIIRSGSNPNTRDCLCTARECNREHSLIGDAIRSKMKRYPPSHGVWLCRVLYQLQETFADEVLSSGGVSLASDCKIQCDCSCCHRKEPFDSGSIATRHCLLRLPICGHIICENQYWKMFLSCGPSESIRCPSCDVSLEYLDLKPYLFPLETDLRRPYGKSMGDCQNGSCMHSDSIDWSENESIMSLTESESRACWDSLPPTLLDGMKVQKRPKFVARSLNQLAGIYLGVTQEARKNELLLACRKGDCRRLRALFAAGIDVNVKDDYGHTPIFVACWFNRPEIVRILLLVGANALESDNFGITPYQLSVVLNHFECRDALLTGSLVRSVCAETCIIRDNPAAIMDTLIRQFHPTGCDLIAFLNRIESEGALHALPESSPIFQSPSVQVLIPFDSNHPGAGSLIADGFVPEAILELLESIFAHLPVAPPEKLTCSHRSYYCDATGLVRLILAQALSNICTELASINISGYSCEAVDSIRVANEFNDAAQASSKVCNEDDDASNSDSDTDEAISNETTSPDKTGVRFCREAMPQMRFLNYVMEGGSLAPHIDLSRIFDERIGLNICSWVKYVNAELCKEHQLLASSTSNGAEQMKQRSSTHTFILYLQSCGEGGETNILRKVPGRRCEFIGEENVIAAVKPKRGRLLIFPHCCPHSGGVVIDTPKLLLRGELI